MEEQQEVSILEGLTTLELLQAEKEFRKNAMQRSRKNVGSSLLCLDKTFLTYLQTFFAMYSS